VSGVAFPQRGRVLALAAVVAWRYPEAARGFDLREIDAFAVPTNATMMAFAPEARVLVLKNSGSAVAVIDLVTRQSELRLANSTFTDITLSPSRAYAFLADYGGENIGYGTPASTSYVHRLDLFNRTAEVRSAYIAGNVQAISDDQVVLKSLDQWVSFTNNAWGTGSALIPLNTPSGWVGPAWYSGVFFGDFRWDSRYRRLIHGNSNLSSQEIQAFGINNNEFLRQEGSATYGTAQGYGGTVVLATDSSAFYYGRLQVDPLDVTHNTRVFPEAIYAANGRIALGNGNVYHARTGALLGTLPFLTTVYAMNGRKVSATGRFSALVADLANLGLSRRSLEERLAALDPDRAVAPGDREERPEIAGAARLQVEDLLDGVVAGSRQSLQ
jgi:hypothetical protein